MSQLYLLRTFISTFFRLALVGLLSFCSGSLLAQCTPPATPATPPELTACLNSGSGVAIWTVSDANLQIDPGGTNGYMISYHPTEQSAIDAINPITGIVSAPTDQTIYARIEDGVDPTCFTVTEISLLTIDEPFPGTDGVAGPFCSTTPVTVDLVTTLNSGTPPDGGGIWSDNNMSGVDLSDPTAVTFSGQLPGDYAFTYTIPAVGGCPEVSATATVTISAGPLANAPADPLRVCYSFSPFGYNADFATLENQITGGTGEPVVYYREAAANMVLDPDDLSLSDLLFLAGLPDPPTVYARVEPAAGCPSATVPVSGVFEEYPEANPASLSSCDDGSGQSTFDLTSLEATINGGSGQTVTYFTDAAATNVIVSSAAYQSASGTVYATVSGDNCESEPVDINLNLFSLTPSITVDNGIDCPGADTGELAVVTSGADPADLSYAWTPATLGDTDNPAGLSAGTYSVVVNNTVTGCSSSPVSATLAEPTAINSTCTVTQDALTPGGSEGIIDLGISGGVAPYTVSWSSASGSSGSTGGVGVGAFSVSNLASGTYSIDIVDASSCTFNCTGLTVGGVSCPITVTFTVTPVVCAGGSDGMIQVDIADGTAPYTIDWTGPASGTQSGIPDPTFTITDLPAGDYTVTVTDGTGCTLTETVTLTGGSGQPVDIFDCVNLPQPSNGSINSYTFSLAGGTPLSDTDPIYIVEVYDEMDNLDFTFNSTTVGADLNPGTYFYNQPVDRGTYTLIAIDEYGCRDTCFITVDPVCPYDFTGSFTVTPPTCDNGGASIQLDTDNGVTSTGNPLTYQWSGGLSGPNPQNVPPGTYSVTISDFYCDIILDNIVVPDLVELDPLSCTVEAEPSTLISDDGQIRVSWTGGTPPFDLNWTGPNNTSDQRVINSGNTTVFNGLGGAGTYDITLEDANGCVQTCSVTLVGPPCPVAIAVCQGVDATAPNADDGTLQIVLLDQADPWTLTYSGTDTDGNPVNGTVNDIFGPVGEVSNLPPGTYDIMILDGAGCELSCGPVTIEEPPCTLAATAIATPAACAAAATGSIDLTVTGAYGTVTYDWNDNTLDGQEDPSGLAAGTYTVNLTDAAGCTFGPLSVTVSEPVALSLTCAGTDASTVGGTDGQVELTFAGGTPPYSAAWTGPASGNQANVATGFVIPDLGAGTYTVTLTDANGCTTTCTATIDEPGCTLSASATATAASCAGATDGRIDLTVTGANGAVTYDWNDNSLDGQEDPSGLAAGTYTVNLTDAAGCTFGPLSVTVSEPVALSLTCAGTDASTVGGTDGQVELTFAGGTPPYSAAWTGPASGNQANVATGFVIPDLGAGTYTVTLTDANGCTTTCTATIDEPACTLSASATATAASCAGATDGRIDLTVTGANGAVTYDWNDNSLDGQEDPSGLAAGTYTVNLTDAVGCTFGPLSVTVGEPVALVLTCSGGSVSTVGGSDGTIDLAVTGGTGPYTAAWTGPVSAVSPSFVDDFIIIDLVAGSYSITLTDANGCTTTCTAQVGEPGCNLSATAMGTDPSCFNGVDGGISLAVSGANGAVTYDWTDDALDGQQIPTGLSAGTYTVNLTDAIGCTFGPLTVTLAEPDLLDLGCVPTDPTTVGGTDGAITLVFTGGTAPFSVSWTGASTGSLTDVNSNDLIDNLGAGTYDITLTDANGCIATCTQTLTEPNCTLSVTFVETNPGCFGAMDGAIDLTVTGASGALTFDWSDDTLDGQQNPTGLAAGTYNVVVSDAAGCELSLDITLVDPAELTATASATAVSCAGGTDGVITVTPSGGTMPYTVTWEVAGFDPLQAPAGTHNFTVTDAAGCSFDGSVTVAEPAVLALECSSTPVTTVGGSDGVGRVTPSGGTPPFTIDWSDASGSLGSETGFAGTAFDIVDLSAGAYQVLVTDANGCTQTCGFTINQPGCDLIVTAVVANPTCAGTDDGAIGLVIEGTAAPFTFDWNVAALNGQEDPQGLAPGSYQVTVTDANGCTEVRNFTLVAPTALQFSCEATDETTTGADDGGVTLTFSGGTPPYALTGDLGTQNNISSPLAIPDLAPGTYEVILTDANGCNQSCSAVVAPAAGCPTIEVATQMIAEDCPGSATGAIAVSATGGTEPYSISWTGGGLTGFNPTGLAAGTYFYTVTDANGCEATGEVTLTTSFTTPGLTLAAPPTGICYTGCAEASFNLSGTPPFSLTYSYTSSTGSGTETVVFSTTAGTWSLCPEDLGLTTLEGVSLEVTAIADANCTASLGLGLVLPVAPPVTSEVTGTYCPDTTLLIGGELFDRDRATGQVVLPGASAQGCDSTINVNLMFLADPVPGEVTVSLCPGDSTVIHGRIFRANEPGATVLLPGGSTAGCDSLVTVTVNTLPPAEGVFTTDACPGDTVFVAGRPFTMDDPNGIVVLPGGSVAGCDSLVSVIVNFSGSEGVVLSGAETICPGESATLFLSYDGPGVVDVVLVDEAGQTQLVSGVDSNTPVVVTPGASQRYQIQAVLGGTAPCPPFGTGEATVTVSNLNVAVRESDAGGGISCAGGTDGILIAGATSGVAPYTYRWSTGDTTAALTSLAAGTYTVTVTDAAGCTQEETATLVAPPPLISEVVGLAPGCNEERGLIRIDRVAGGSGDYAFSLDGGTLTSINDVPFSRSVLPGDYAVQIIDGNGCRDTVNVRVPTGDAAVLALPPDTTILLGDSILIVGQTSLNPDAILWSPPDGFSSQNGLSIVANPLETTVYRLEVRDDAGCVQRASMTVFVDRETTLYAPTGFSPNEDGRNDLFRLYSGPSVERIEMFQIFNRWGELLYQDGPLDPFDPNWGWDGTYRGELLNPAVFVYRAEVTLVDGRRVIFQGDLTLLR